MRRFCIGDIHGKYDRLQDVLERCKFSDDDILYSVGDFCDRGNQNLKTLNFLMDLKNFQPVIGNHDTWLYFWADWKANKTPLNRYAFECWHDWNGGVRTVAELKDQDQEWFNKLYDWLKDIPYIRHLDNDRVIVHSVAPSNIIKNRQVNMPIDEITLETLLESGLLQDEEYDSALWNRDVIRSCRGYLDLEGRRGFGTNYFAEEFKGIPVYFIGHTPLFGPFYDADMGIVGLDTGSFCDTKDGWDIDGRITVVDIDTFDCWQSKVWYQKEKECWQFNLLEDWNKAKESR